MLRKQYLNENKKNSQDKNLLPDAKENYFAQLQNKQSLVKKEFNYLVNGFASYKISYSHPSNVTWNELNEQQTVIEDVIKYNNKHLKKLSSKLEQVETIQLSYVVRTEEKRKGHKKTQSVSKFIEKNLSIQHLIRVEINKTKLELKKLDESKFKNLQNKVNFEQYHLEKGNYGEVQFNQFSLILKHVQNTNVFKDFVKYGSKKNSAKTKQIEKYIDEIKNAETLDKLFIVIQSDPVADGVNFSMRENRKEYGGWYSFFHKGLQSTSDNYAVAIQKDLIKFIETKFTVTVPDKYKIFPGEKNGPRNVPLRK